MVWVGRLCPLKGDSALMRVPLPPLQTSERAVCHERQQVQRPDLREVSRLLAAYESVVAVLAAFGAPAAMHAAAKRKDADAEIARLNE